LNKNSIYNLIESGTNFFEEILNEYRFYLKVGNSPEDKWFNKLLTRRQSYIDKIEIIFKNKKYFEIFKNEIPDNLKTKFKKIIKEILELDSISKEVLFNAQNKKSEQLLKIKKFNKLSIENIDSIHKSKVINIAVK
tara:strand:- start:30 stop:437 length:408 start_codon:yes stop_codon:yes gene_type:complete